jgi:hypothetical protein
VLECIHADPRVRLRDIADSVGITERTAALIVTDLEQAGYLTKTRDGRRNRYEVHGELPLRHPRHRHRTVGDLIGSSRPRAARQVRALGKHEKCRGHIARFWQHAELLRRSGRRLQ